MLTNFKVKFWDAIYVMYGKTIFIILQSWMREKNLTGVMRSLDKIK